MPSWNHLPTWLFDPTFSKLIAALLGVVVVALLVGFVRRLLSRYVQDHQVRYKTRKFATVGGYVLALAWIAGVLSERLGSLTVTLGVAGAGLAFALQEVVASFAGWFAISFARFYNPGDRVLLGGIRGDVIDIGFLRTTLMELGDWVKGDLYNGRVVRIANSFVFKAPVFNYSANFAFLWDEITVPVKYGGDRALAREILTRVTGEVVGIYVPAATVAWEKFSKGFLIEDASVQPAVTLVATDNWLEYTVRYVVDYKRRRATKDQLFTKILDALDQTQGRVAIASATFQLVEAPTFDVRLAPDRTAPEKSRRDG